MKTLLALILLSACGLKPTDKQATAGGGCAADGHLVYESQRDPINNPLAYRVTLDACAVKIEREDGCTFTGTRSDKNEDTGEYYANIGTKSASCGTLAVPSLCTGYREDVGHSLFVSCMDLGMSVYLQQTE